MVRVSGRLLDFVEDPSQVAEVQVWAKRVSPHGDGLMTDHPVTVDWDPDTGTVSFDAAAGTIGVISWVSVGRTHPSEGLPLVVPDKAEAMLREVVEAAMLADEHTITELQRLALEVADKVATITNITLLEGWADSAKKDAADASADSGRAEAARVISERIATNLPDTISSELDARVPPEVAEALADDRAVADAAAIAVSDAAVGLDLVERSTIQHILTEQTRLIPKDADWNTITTQGRWKKPSTSYGGTNIPPTPTTNAPGELIVFNPGNSTNFVGQLFFGYAVGAAEVISNGLWYRSSTTVNLFSPWERIDNGAAVTDLAGRVTAIENSSSPTDPPSAGEVPAHSADGAWEQNQALMTDFIQSMGGTIPTGGRGVVSFRFDHGMKNFAEIVLPKMRSAGIKVAQTMNARNWARAENDGYTATDLNRWVRDGEVEVWNHGASHIETSDPATQYDEIVTGLAELKAQLPDAKIWGFMPPGTGSTYFTFRNGAQADEWASYPGRLILKHHAVATGYMPGTHQRVLDGNPRNGLTHYTLDRQTVQYAKARIDEAAENGRGINFMVHPNLINYSSDYITTGMFYEIVDYVVARRDAGDIMILSPYEMLVADASGAEDVASPAEYDSGVRDITGLVPGVVTGKLFVSRIGSTVWLDFDQLVVEDPAGTYHSWEGVLPAGFRVARNYQYFPLIAVTTGNTTGPLRLDTRGGLVIYNVKPAKRMDGLVSFPTRDAEPVTKPGTPA